MESLFKLGLPVILFQTNYKCWLEYWVIYATKLLLRYSCEFWLILVFPTCWGWIKPILRCRKVARRQSICAECKMCWLDQKCQILGQQVFTRTSVYLGTSLKVLDCFQTEDAWRNGTIFDQNYMTNRSHFWVPKFSSSI